MSTGPDLAPAARCPSDDTLTGLAHGELGAAGREAIVRHLDDCDACLARLADAGLAVEPATSADPPQSRARSVGRYQLRRLLGMGGMGLVYEAYDPDLQRSVAIKVLRPGQHSGRALEERLVREARALARLSHRNIVQVYDAGMRGGDVFVCMELIAGRTLRDVLEQRPGWREVVRLFLAIGRGLSAAHAAGIVHRDVKPENVLISDDGRILVSDFGLAGEAVPPSAPGPAGGPLASRLTAVAGTPAYMAPEQLRGTPADARSDQFSFCVALAEALGGGRPPEPAGLSDEQRRAALLARLERGPGRGPGRVPGRVVRAIRRGLASAPQERFAHLEQLVFELEQAHRYRRRIAIAIAVSAGALAIAAAGSALVLLARGHHEPSACERETARLAAIWSPAQRTALFGALATALPKGSPGASDLPRRVAQQVDEIAAAWARAHRDSCRALESGAASSASRAEQLCLEECLLQLERYVQLTIRDPRVAIHALALGREVGQRQRCRIQLAGDAAAGTRMMTLWGQLRGLSLERQSAGAPAVLERARRLLPEVRALGDVGLEAEWLAFIGNLEHHGDPVAASATLRAALQAADRARRDDVRVHAMLGMAAIGIMTSNLDEAESWAGQAEGALARDAARWEERPDAAGRGADELLEASLRNLQGVIAGQRARPEEGIRYASRALELWQRAGHPNAAAAHNTIATQLHALHDEAGALEHLQQGVELAERQLGPLHPHTGLALVNLATTLFHLDRIPEAIPLLERARALLEAIEAKAQLPYALVLLATCYRRTGEPARGAATAERCVAVASAALGEKHDLTGRCMVELGLGREREGALLALPPLERALEVLHEATDETEVRARARAAAAAARLLWARGQRGDRARARGLAAAAERDFQATNTGDQIEHRELVSWRRRARL